MPKRLRDQRNGLCGLLDVLSETVSARRGLARQAGRYLLLPSSALQSLIDRQAAVEYPMISTRLSLNGETRLQLSDVLNAPL